jgi:hypothetical protein
VREDPDREGLLYLGTEFGIFLSLDDGQSWQEFQQNLPVTPVTDIRVHRQDLVLATMGRSFWILDDLTPLHAIPDLHPTTPHLFAPRTSYRTRHASSRQSSSDPEYPPPGVLITYFLSHPASERLTLEILDDRDSVIRAYVQDSSSAEEDRQTFGRPAGGALDRSPGLHRFRWDMRYGSSEGPPARRSSLAGPLAVPGRYTVRLTNGAWTAAQTFTLALDPRVAADGVTATDLEHQLRVSLAVRDVFNDVDALLTSVREALSARDASAERTTALRRIEARLATDRSQRYPEPKLVDQIRYLYGILQGADYGPGADATKRAAELRERVDTLGREFAAAMAR